MHVFPLSKRVHRYDQTLKFRHSVDIPSPISRIPNAAAYIEANICDQRVCQNQGLTLKVGVEFEWGQLDPRNEAQLTSASQMLQLLDEEMLRPQHTWRGWSSRGPEAAAGV